MFYLLKVPKKLLLCGHAGLSSCMQQLSQIRLSFLQVFHLLLGIALIVTV